MNFFDNALTVGTQVLILFLMIGVGFFTRKRGWIDENGGHQMTRVLLNIVTPCIIIQSFQTLDMAHETLKQMGVTVLFAVAAHVIGLILGALIFRKGSADARALYRFAVVFSNCSFIGIPVTAAVFGSESVVWVSLYIAVFNFFAWTIGVAYFNRAGKLSIQKLLVNPGIIGIAIGLALYLARLELPVILSTPLAAFAALNTPLAMLVTGCFLAGASLLPQKGDAPMWLAIALRLLALPLLMLGGAYVLGLRSEAVIACVVPLCAPISTMAILFPTQYNGDVALGVRMTQMSNLASALTMPMMIALAQIVLR